MAGSLDWLARRVYTVVGCFNFYPAKHSLHRRIECYVIDLFRFAEYHVSLVSSLLRSFTNTPSITCIMPWQKRFTLPPHTKGMHLVTEAVLRECQEGLRGIDIGIFTLNCLHTSAGLTVSMHSLDAPETSSCSRSMRIVIREHCLAYLLVYQSV